LTSFTGKTHLSQIALKCPNLEVLQLETVEDSFDEIESFYQITPQHLFEKLSVLTIEWTLMPSDMKAFFSYFPNLCELTFIGSYDDGYHVCNPDAYRVLGASIPRSVRFVTLAAICVSCTKAFLKHVQLAVLRVQAAEKEFYRFEILLKPPVDHTDNFFVQGTNVSDGRHIINGELVGESGYLFFRPTLSRIQ
jgi:hypothetical protein